MTNGHGTHVPTPDQELLQRQRGPVALLLVLLGGFGGGSAVTYGVDRARGVGSCPSTVARKASSCTCPTCPKNQRCTASTCPTCVDLAVSQELRINEVERRLDQMAVCGDPLLLDAALR